MLTSVFIVDLTRFFCLDFRDNYVKTNEDTPVLLATKMVARDLVSSLGFTREDASTTSGVVGNGQFSMLLVAIIFRTFKHSAKVILKTNDKSIQHGL